MATANPTWGAPRIHGELKKLGFTISERTVSRLMPKTTGRPSQTWMTFLRNHVGQMVSVDFFTVPTIRLRVLYVFVVLAHDRRRVAFQCHGTPDCRVDGTAARGSISRRHCASLLGARS